MTTLTVAGVLLGGALAGCGGGTPPPLAPVPTPPAAAASPAPPKKPPTMAPGPAGRTPVFERRPTTGTPAGGSPSDEKVVALSFDADMTADQGPRAKAGERFDNPELIALLRRLKVPSTVFMTGRWAEEYPAQAKDIGADDLFEVANHSYSHYAFTADCYGLPVVAKETMARDVERAFAAFREAGVRNVVPYFRFPGGCYDDAALRALAPANVTAVQWDVVSGDAFATDAGAVARQVLDGVRPGSLVVLHCTRSAAPVTGEAVGRIVPELRKRGYRFVKVSELMEG
ncbi:polysaccharide deacetylase family protein [Streptomyces sp. OUCMDZ-4982]|uniref:polysaccharide deacetylase family protein n=1 Tax=Streptomyces sp. OUCMDZ-4982 TaxID=2973090 RepID=UPI00215C7C03|nr:polysaccharide deacetylase family protein [Streptomyces sp. OUCMDZ-4982]MCR8946162.1 polysaccharide deacetylase family protein [Streptomyces sp. OUCMDZ-4982]